MALLNIERFKRYCSYREKNTKNFENNKIQVLRAGIQKIIPKSFKTNSILWDSQDTEVIKSDRAIDELPIRSIIFSIDTASCQLPNTLLKVPVIDSFCRVPCHTVFYLQKVTKNEMVEQIALSTKKINEKESLADSF